MAEWFLSLWPRPSAGIVFNSVLCESLMRELPQRGVSCPEDVSLVSKMPDYESSDITCMEGSVTAMGETAADLMVDRATGRRSSAVRLAIPSVLRRGRTVRQLA